MQLHWNNTTKILTWDGTEFGSYSLLKDGTAIGGFDEEENPLPDNTYYPGVASGLDMTNDFYVQAGGVPFPAGDYYIYSLVDNPGDPQILEGYLAWDEVNGTLNGVEETTVPDAIDDLVASVGVGSLEFTWSEPDDGGAEITKYTLYLNGAEHTDDVESPYEVTGLTGGVASGPWTVTATNSEGESDPSNNVLAHARHTPWRVRNSRSLVLSPWWLRVWLEWVRR